LLRQFGRIYAQQADAVAADPETVAIAGAGLARDRRGWPIESGRDKGQHRQGGDDQDVPAAPLEERVAVA